MNEMTHIFTESGLGLAPFKFVGVYEIPSPSLAEANVTAYNNALAAMPHGYGIGACNHCGTPIKYNFLIESSDGVKSAVGCECIKKSNDSGLISKAKAHEKKRAQAKRDEKRAAKMKAQQEKAEAELQAQRERNDGLTDHELFMAKLKQKEQARAELLTPIIEVMRDGNGGFRDSIADSMENGNVPSGRGLAIALDIIGKEHGRRASADYYAAREWASEIFENVEKLDCDNIYK